MTCLGISDDPLSELSPLNAAEMMYATGKSAARHRDQRDQVAPPRVAETRPLLAPTLRDRGDGELGFACAHARFSSARVRENEIAEIVPTMTKMRIAIALARP